MDYLFNKQHTSIWAIGSLVLMIMVYLRPGPKLDHIPAIGSKSYILSFISAIKFLFNARDIIQQGSDQYRDSAFRVPSLTGWTVVITGSKLIEDLRKAPENTLSFGEALDEALQISYTLGDRISKNPYHVAIVRSQLTRNLPALFPALQEEVLAAFQDVLSLQGDSWKKFKPMEMILPIVCRANNRIFVGAPLCRDPDFVDINAQFTNTTMKSVLVLYLCPSFLKPVIGRFLTSVPTSIDRAMEHLRPVVEERRQKIKEHGTDYPGKPFDFLSWLMDEAKDDENSLRNLTLRILTLNFAAIHTSATTFVHALLYLATYPEYAQPMRDEIKEIVDREGWTHRSLNQMTKIDSFMKETQRLNSLSCVLMGRVARQPFTFSDGTYIPKGTTVQVAALPTHIDEANYSDPTAFQPFRFVDKNRKENIGRKVDMVSTHSDFVAFGHGRHACPGRFFAADELKLMLAHIVMSYDVKLEKEGVRPKDMWFASGCMPNSSAEVMFRKREN